MTARTGQIRGILLAAALILCGMMNAAPVPRRPKLPVVDNGKPIVDGPTEHTVKQPQQQKPQPPQQKPQPPQQKPQPQQQKPQPPQQKPQPPQQKPQPPQQKPQPQQQKPPAAKPAAPAQKAVPLTFAEITHKDRKYYDLKTIAARYRFRVIEGKAEKLRVITLVTPRKETLVFTEKKPLFVIGGLHASLSYPVVYEKGRYLLEKTDYSEFIEPLLRTTLLPRRTIKHIVIDAGHGGKDQGAASGKVLEKNLNLIMARKIASILRIRGYQVSLTRTGDKALSLQERCDFATKKKPDLFLSVHCNSAEDISINGIEVFLANPPKAPSFGTANLGKEGAATPFQKTSALWAFFTQKALVGATKATDRGIKRKQFKVIIDTPAPALLVELGFLSNKDELQKLLTKDYQDKLADALCDAIDKLSKTLKPTTK